MVDKTEVVAAMVVATEDMAAVADIETAVKEEKADTEIAVANVTEVVTEAMVAAAVASNIQVLKFPLLRKVKIHKCFLIILSSKRTHS